MWWVKPWSHLHLYWMQSLLRDVSCVCAAVLDLWSFWVRYITHQYVVVWFLACTSFETSFEPWFSEVVWFSVMEIRNARKNYSVEKKDVSCKNAFFRAWDMVVKCKYSINAFSPSSLVIPQWEAGRHREIFFQASPTINQVVVRIENGLKIGAFSSYRDFNLIYKDFL